MNDLNVYNCLHKLLSYASLVYPAINKHPAPEVALLLAQLPSERADVMLPIGITRP